MKIREKKIYSGNILEPEFYPVTADGRRYSRGKKKNKSRAVQKKLNDKNARKKLRRLIEANFTEQDYYCTFTYRDNEMPIEYENVKKDINNFLRKLRRYRNKNELSELKYIYTVECKVSKRTLKARWHFHIVLSGGIERKQIKAMWKHGDIKRVEELQPTERGYESLANYLCKEWTNEFMPESRKRYTPSRNLKQPTVREKDGVFSAAHLAKLCKQRIDDNEYWERRYKGYRFISADAYYNDDFGYWTLNLMMKKKE